MFAIRIQLSKTGNARFISHLDLMRTMTRALKRAEIPVKYTQGFNPHPYLVFSSPLSLGITSECELLDIKLGEEISSSAIVEKLNNSLPFGIKAIDAYEETRNFNDIIFARYLITFSTENKNDFSAFLDQENILVQKKSKKGGFNTLDLKPDIQLEQLSENSAIIVLPCGNMKNIGINLVVESFKKYANISDKPVFIERLAFLDKDMLIFK